MKYIVILVGKLIKYDFKKYKFNYYLEDDDNFIIEYKTKKGGTKGVLF